MQPFAKVLEVTETRRHENYLSVIIFIKKSKILFIFFLRSSRQSSLLRISKNKIGMKATPD
jgi:hypothetical protein